MLISPPKESSRDQRDICFGHRRNFSCRPHYHFSLEQHEPCVSVAEDDAPVTALTFRRGARNSWSMDHNSTKQLKVSICEHGRSTYVLRQLRAGPRCWNGACVFFYSPHHALADVCHSQTNKRRMHAVTWYPGTPDISYVMITRSHLSAQRAFFAPPSIAPANARAMDFHHLLIPCIQPRISPADAVNSAFRDALKRHWGMWRGSPISLGSTTRLSGVIERRKLEMHAEVAA